jgi:protein-tyrosine phosphatase
VNRLDVTWVDSDLAVGAALPAASAADLCASDIRRIVDLRAEACDDASTLRAHRIELLHLPTADRAPVAPLALDVGVAWVCEALARGGRVLIHCQRGIARSAMLASCVMVARGVHLPGALRSLKQARRGLSLSLDQLGGLVKWVEQRARRRAEPAELVWDELVAMVCQPAV